MLEPADIAVEERAQVVHPVLEHRQAIDDAEANLRLNRVDVRAVRLQAARVEDALEQLSRGTFDTVILDPPRAGAQDQVREIAASPVARVAYVSCNPATFARDAEILVGGGYKLDWVLPVGQFRWSTHVELAACLTR